MEEKRIPINIWDDYYDDGYVPEGEKQETYLYVEDSKVNKDKEKEYLDTLLKYMTENLNLEGVKVWLLFYDSKLRYPSLVGTENEYLLFERWEIRFENLTHKRRHELVDELNAANLSLDGILFETYSES